MATDLVKFDELIATPLTNEMVVSADFNTRYQELLDAIVKLEDIKVAVNNEIKELLRDQYQSTGDQTLHGSQYTYTYLPGSLRETFDTKAFKEAHPDLYKEYVKLNAVSESLRVNKNKK